MKSLRTHVMSNPKIVNISVAHNDRTEVVWLTLRKTRILCLLFLISYKSAKHLLKNNPN